MSPRIKTKRQANFKNFKRFAAFKGLVEQKNVYSKRKIEKKRFISPPAYEVITECLKGTFKVKKDVDISNFIKMNPFLKYVEYKPKNSTVFTKQDVTNFLLETLDEYYFYT
jgi:hypothetical protein